MPDNLYDAAQDALRTLSQGMPIASPPGSEPIALKDQYAQFIADLPDLVFGGPRADEIRQAHGDAGLHEYVTSMMSKIAGRRQRRRPM